MCTYIYVCVCVCVCVIYRPITAYVCIFMRSQNANLGTFNEGQSTPHSCYIQQQFPPLSPTPHKLPSMH